MIEPDGRRVIAWFHVKIEEFCYFHGWEPDLPGDYRACLECAHIFRTEQELVDAHNAILEEMKKYGDVGPPATNAEEIWACPHCTHDF